MSPKMLWVSQVDSVARKTREHTPAASQPQRHAADTGVHLRRGRSGRPIAVPILVVKINKGARAGRAGHSGMVGARNVASRAPGAACTAHGSNTLKADSPACTPCAKMYVLHSELRLLDSRERPPSISSQSLMKVNSTATDGPVLVSPSGKVRSAAPPISRIAVGSLSLSEACAPTATSDSETVKNSRRRIHPPTMLHGLL
jgi:hypothetical protein